MAMQPFAKYFGHSFMCSYGRHNFLCFFKQLGVEAAGLAPWWEVPRMLLLGLPKRSISKPDQCRKDTVLQQSLGTDML